MKFRWIRYIAERLPKEIRERKKTEIEACFTGTKKQLEEKQDKLNRSRDRILQEANQQAAAILKEAKDTPSDNSNVFESGQENSDHKR